MYEVNVFDVEQKVTPYSCGIRGGRIEGWRDKQDLTVTGSIPLRFD